jgi:hypothetical protein
MRYGVWMTVACLAGCATPPNNTYHMRHSLDPATREATPVDARCAFAFHFALD